MPQCKGMQWWSGRSGQVGGLVGEHPSRIRVKRDGWGFAEGKPGEKITLELETNKLSF